MKSAYEIAMERMNAESGQQRTLSHEERREVAKIDEKYDARIAEITLEFDAKISITPPPESDVILAEKAREIQRLEEKREEEKERVWSGGEG